MKVPAPFYVFFALDAADRFQNPLCVSLPEMLLTQVLNPLCVFFELDVRG